jgi:hypothetical protein
VTAHPAIAGRETGSMKRYAKIILFGFLLWLILLIVSILIFPFRVSQRPLFESIMAVVVTAWAVFFAVLYLLNLNGNYKKDGILIGAAWFLISIALDLPLFMEGSMKMSPADYMADIGLTYLIIPVVTSGLGFLAEAVSSKKDGA